MSVVAENLLEIESPIVLLQVQGKPRDVSCLRYTETDKEDSTHFGSLQDVCSVGVEWEAIDRSQK